MCLRLAYQVVNKVIELRSCTLVLSLMLSSSEAFRYCYIGLSLRLNVSNPNMAFGQRFETAEQESDVITHHL